MSDLTTDAQTAGSDGSRRERRRSRYDRPRRSIFWTPLLIGVLIGIGGGIFFAWNIAPAEEFDTEPWQLNPADKANYVVAILIAYDYDGNLPRTIETLLQLRPPGDPIDYVAQVACDLARTGYVDSSSGLSAIRAMMRFYQGQQRTGCADALIPPDNDLPETEAVVVLPTPTLPPPPTKTPVPDLASGTTPTAGAAVVVASPQPRSSFRIARLDPPFCDAAFPGVIEVYVQDASGAALPGQPVRVRWDTGESTFFTGLKPERGLDYADFQMETGKGYTVEMPGLSDPTTAPIVAEPCTADDGQASVSSYRLVFRPAFN